MIANRIKVSKESTDKMKQLKIKLKTEHLYPIARMALALSLEEERPPTKDFYREDGMEFSRLTLFGEYDPIYMCLLKERGFYKKPRKNNDFQKCTYLGIKEMTTYMVSHINRGVVQLYARVKSQEDLLNLIKEQSL